MKPDYRNDDRIEIERLRGVLTKFISWIGQSANNPLSRDETVMLLDELNPPAGRER